MQLLNSRQGLFALLICLILIPASESQSQNLKSGAWTGFVLPPNGQQVDVTFNVVSRADSLSIDLDAGPMGVLPANNIELSESELAFTFTPGPVVHCLLKHKANGDYEGFCAPDGEEEGTIVMKQPVEQADGN